MSLQGLFEGGVRTKHALEGEGGEERDVERVRWKEGCKSGAAGMSEKMCAWAWWSAEKGSWRVCNRGG